MKSSIHILKRRFLKWGWANKIIKFSPKIFVRDVCLVCSLDIREKSLICVFVRIRLLNFTQDIRARCLLELDTNFILQLPISVSAPHDFLSFTHHPTKKDVSHDTPLLLSIIFCFLLLLIFLLLRMAIMHMEGLLCSVQGEVVLFRIHYLLQECRLLLALIIMKVMFPLLMLC